MTPELIATILATLVAVGTGFRTLRNTLRQDDAGFTVVDMLQAEVKRQYEVNERLQQGYSLIYADNIQLRASLDQVNRELLELKLQLSRTKYELEKLRESNAPDSQY